ncbi:MAG: guanylate kinase [Bacteroidia bacterium]|nr:MAG: guanylate kinase [Bacteroidia bacterium]
MGKGKILIFSAPSGAGKTTIVQNLIKFADCYEFSISATSRQKRPDEIHGKDYYFISADEFRDKIDKNEFVEWEEVYEKTFYGTLKSEIERIRNKNKHIVFDVDVKGGLNIKKQFPDESLSIFIMPPSIEELERRLIARGTETETSLQKRIAKAKYELSFAQQFDERIVNDNLKTAIAEVKQRVHKFLSK